MLGRTLVKAAAGLLIALSGIATAHAQTYDGSGLVKFGVFGQGTFLEIDEKLPAIANGSSNGFAGGVSAGYDLTLHRSVLMGLEVDGSFGDIRDTPFLTDYGMDWLLTIRGRLGFYARPGWLIYGTAGVGFLGMEAQRPGVGNKAAETLTGFVGGVGTEVDWSHVILFTEYLYGNFDGGFEIPQGALLPAIDHKVDIDAHLIRVGLKFKVGHDYAHDTYDHPDQYKRREPLK